MIENYINFKESLMCSISHQIFLDPVIAEDGQTYERTCIEKWFETSNKSPITNKSINKKLITNYFVKQLVQHFLDNNYIKKEEIFIEPHIKFDFVKFMNNPNDVKQIKKLLDHSDLNITDEEGRNPFHYIFFKTKNEEILKYAIDKCTDMDSRMIDGSTCTHILFEFCNANIIKYALNKNINVNLQNNEGNYPVHLASKTNCEEKIKFIIDNLDMNVKNNKGSYPIHFICNRKNNNVIKYAIEKGINMNVHSNTHVYPIHIISSKCDFDIILFAIKNNINMNVRADNNKYPIHYILSNLEINHEINLENFFQKFPSLLSELNKILEKIDFNVQDDDGLYPIHYACIHFSDKIVKSIIDYGSNYGIDFHVKTNDGLKPIHYISKYKNIDTIKYAIAKGL